MANQRPNPNEAFPNPNLPRLCFIKNVVKNPRIIIGDYTYYDDVDGADQFEKHVTHFYDFIGDKLIIGKFCAIAKGVEFVMNGANHRMERCQSQDGLCYNISLLYHGWRLGKCHCTSERRIILITGAYSLARPL